MTDFRDAVFSAVHDLARADPNVVVLTNDMGALGLDAIAAEFPARVINAGIAEQNLMSVAGGLAASGKRVFVYGIIEHIVLRALEQIKLDICVPQLPVVIIGIGAGLSYGTDGPTHHGVEDIACMRALAGMTIYNPADGASARWAVKAAYEARTPHYIRLDKENVEDLWSWTKGELDAGFRLLWDGDNVVIVSSGITTHAATEACTPLIREGIATAVVDVLRLKPLGGGVLADALAPYSTVLTVEESNHTGGIGTIVAECLADHGLHPRFRRLSLGDGYLMGTTRRPHPALTAAAIAQAVRELLA